ncbi:hypothetical protein AB0J99_11790 [Micromonospora echinaurantiaca]
MSDAHASLVAAIGPALPGASWQRRTRYLRNLADEDAQVGAAVDRHRGAHERATRCGAVLRESLKNPGDDRMRGSYLSTPALSSSHAVAGRLTPLLRRRRETAQGGRRRRTWR